MAVTNAQCNAMFDHHARAKNKIESSGWLDFCELATFLLDIRNGISDLSCIPHHSLWGHQWKFLCDDLRAETIKHC